MATIYKPTPQEINAVIKKRLVVKKVPIRIKVPVLNTPKINNQK